MSDKEKKSNEKRLKPFKRWNSPGVKAKFLTLEDLFEIGGNFLCVIEEPYGFPPEEGEDSPRIKNINYGHIVGVMNSADKNEWDIIFPSSNEPLNMVMCDKIVGYVHDSKGNHKLIGMCYGAPNSTKENFYTNIRNYVKKRRDVYDDECTAYIFKELDEEIQNNYTDY